MIHNINESNNVHGTTTDLLVFVGFNEPLETTSPLTLAVVRLLLERNVEGLSVSHDYLGVAVNMNLDEPDPQAMVYPVDYLLDWDEARPLPSFTHLVIYRGASGLFALCGNFGGLEIGSLALEEYHCVGAWQGEECWNHKDVEEHDETTLSVYSYWQQFWI